MSIPTVSWSETDPAGSEAKSNGDNRIREMKTQIREVVDVEHQFNSSGQSAQNGIHSKGSSRAYYQSSDPTTRPDGSTSLDTNDDGRLMVDTDDNTIRVWNGSSFDDVSVAAIEDITKGTVSASGVVIVDSNKKVDVWDPTILKISGTTVSSTADELNKLDGASSNVTATNFNTLTAGGTSDASSLHYHPITYQTGTITGTMNGSLQTIGSVTLTVPSGAAVLIIVFMQQTSGTTSGQLFHINDGSSNIYSSTSYNQSESGSHEPFALHYVATSYSGSTTFSIKAQNISGSAVFSGRISAVILAQ